MIKKHSILVKVLNILFNLYTSEVKITFIKEGVNLPELQNIQKNLVGSTGWAPGA